MQVVYYSVRERLEKICRDHQHRNLVKHVELTTSEFRSLKADPGFPKEHDANDPLYFMGVKIVVLPDEETREKHEDI